MIRVLIADDQTLMRDGLKTILELEDDINVVGTARNGMEAYKLVGELNPNLVLMDIRMPVMDGVESTRLIKMNYPEVNVLILTTFNDEEYIVQALDNGARGYLLKDMPSEKFVQAVKDGAVGNILMPSEVAEILATRIIRMESGIKEIEGKLSLDFSEREKEIALLIARGLNNRQISATLCISEGTVKNYISKIYSKVGISDRAKVAIYLQECIL